ncbi:MAG: GNAT family N-acetyltransferase [Calditrichaeota bacterium]|nr:MAG: GNAT family N-acetyltransferase [Calditrichota bacterium]
MQSYKIKSLGPGDKSWVAAFLKEHWNSPEIVTRGRVHRADELPGFVAVHDEHRLGLVTYRIEAGECEIVTLNSLCQGMGIGTELLKAVIQAAAEAGCKRVWAVTTNDNLDALRFFQTRGFVLAALHRNAVEEARDIKPDIPTHGFDSIPIRDEIEVELNF